MVVVPGFAGALLRGRAAVVAITAGAVAAPIGAFFALDGSCEPNMWAAIGMVAIAFYVLIIAGLASFAGDRIGGSHRFEGNRVHGTSVLVIVGATGVLGWIAYVAMLGGCP